MFKDRKNSIDINFNASYANSIHVEEFKNTTLNNLVVHEVLYDKDLITIGHRKNNIYLHEKNE